MSLTCKLKLLFFVCFGLTFFTFVESNNTVSTFRCSEGAFKIRAKFDSAVLVQIDTRTFFDFDPVICTTPVGVTYWYGSIRWKYKKFYSSGSCRPNLMIKIFPNVTMRACGTKYIKPDHEYTYNTGEVQLVVARNTTNKDAYLTAEIEFYMNESRSPESIEVEESAARLRAILIGVAVGVVVLFVIGAVLVMVRWKHRRRQRLTARTTAAHGQGWSLGGQAPQGVAMMDYPMGKPVFNYPQNPVDVAALVPPYNRTVPYPILPPGDNPQTFSLVQNQDCGPDSKS